MGILSDVKLEGNGLGCEGSGIVVRVGPKVKELKLGDRVMFSSSGAFSTALSITEKLCAKISDSLSFAEAATMPCVYSTAIYCLMEIGRMQVGQVRNWQVFHVRSTKWL
jgi:NADPH:quinone reductase-like Zn-dependent oxidoreductase